MDGCVQCLPVNLMKSVPWDREVVVVDQPWMHDWALDGSTKEIGLESGLLATTDGKAPIFTQELWICEGSSVWVRLLKEVFGCRKIGKVIDQGPQQVQVGNTSFALVALHPLPFDGNWEVVNHSSSGLLACRSGCGRPINHLRI